MGDTFDRADARWQNARRRGERWAAENAYVMGCRAVHEECVGLAERAGRRRFF